MRSGESGGHKAALSSDSKHVRRCNVGVPGGVEYEARRGGVAVVDVDEERASEEARGVSE